MPMIKLQSSDGEVFQVDYEIAKASETIKTMIETLGLKEDDEIIPLANVKASILKKVILWATHHKDDPPPAEDKNEVKYHTNKLPDWDIDFLKLDQCILFEIILAANYLEIKGLLEMTCMTVANMMSGKTAEEIRKLLNIKSDFTGVEEDQLRQENEWCMEK